MDRILLIARERKTAVLLALAALTIAVLAAIGSGAWFTARTSSPGASVTAGTLKLSNDADSMFFLEADNMAPGDEQVGTVTITNDGTLPGTLAIAMNDYSGLETPGEASDGTPGNVLSEDLNLKIEDDMATVLYDGPLNGIMTDDFTAITDPINPLDGGTSRTYTFTVHFNNNGEPADISSDDNLYQGAHSEFPFTWEIHSQETPLP